MADIGYFEAWQMWLDGRSTLGNEMFGLPMIWWGRAGKIAAFVSGMTILLDIAGPERLASFADRLHAFIQTVWSRAKASSIPIHAFFVVLGWVVMRNAVRSIDIPGPVGNLGWNLLIGLLQVVVIIMLAVVAELAVTGTALLIEKVCAKLPAIFMHPRAVHIRIVATVLLIIGFHFDLLSS